MVDSVFSINIDWNRGPTVAAMKQSLKTRFRFHVATGIAATALLTLVGCTTFCDKMQHHHGNNLFNYLYSDQASHIDTPSIPTLSLPLRVGVAFVPSDNSDSRPYATREDWTFSEPQKMALMKEVSTHFQNYAFVKNIELIPTAYLAPRGGFRNLDQLRSIYGIDVIVLLSYDQVQFTDEGLLSVSYWTIVGAWVVEGEKNDTRTLLDAAVYDIASRKLLFRAPGISEVKGSATPINLDEELRLDRERGYQRAATNLVTNLKVQLEEFRDRVKNTPEEYHIVHKPGYVGAGSAGPLELTLAATLLAAYLWNRRSTKA